MDIVSVRVVQIGPAEAERMIDDFPYDRQRGVSAARVEYYAEMMKAGKWRPGSEIELATAPNGDGLVHTYLVNGQHRLQSVIQSGERQTFVLKEVACGSQEELAEEYGSIDTARVRNVADFVRATGMAETLGLSEFDCAQVGTAAVVVENDFRKSSRYHVTPYRRLELVRYYAPVARELFGLYAGGVAYLTRQLRYSGPLAVGLVTMDEAIQIYGLQKVSDFWQGVSHDNGLVVGDPRKAVVRHLVEASQTTVARGGKISLEYTTRYLAHCFNGWVEDRSMRYSRVLDSLVDITINGTRWDKKPGGPMGEEMERPGEGSEIERRRPRKR